MSTLKIKIRVNNLEIELEGDNEVVIQQIKELKENGLGNLISNAKTKIPIEETPYSREENNSNQEIESSDDYPHLKDIVMKDLPKTEKEWIIVYAFYTSEFGTKPFTKDNLIKGYDDTNRKTDNRMKNFAGNVRDLVKEDFFKSLNDKEILLKPKGIIEAKKILSGNNNTKHKRTIKKEINTKLPETTNDKNE